MLKKYGWSAVKLSDHYTLAELEMIRQEIVTDPANSERGGLYLYTKSARRKLDSLSWAVYYKLLEKDVDVSVTICDKGSSTNGDAK